MKCLPLACVFFATACVTHAPKQEQSSQLPAAGAPVLYGRDGTPVWNAGTGSTLTRNNPSGEATNAEGSRVYLLELYQQAIDEKEQLGLEVKSLNATLERVQADLHSEKDKNSACTAEAASLRAELERARAENLELAGRLVTAQIRRLESEKLLLEHKIEAARLATASNPDAVAKPAASPSSTTSKTEKP